VICIVVAVHTTHQNCTLKTLLLVNTVIQILEMAVGLAYKYACSLSSRIRGERRRIGRG